jgi:eukaryotic-like serine/threonine-protein kinase
LTIDLIQSERGDFSMAEPAADRNLLFGILALQMDFITRDGLVAAMNAWLLEKHRPLADLLEESGSLKPAARALLEPLVRHHIEEHGGDAAKSLASLSSVDWIRADLAPIGKADSEVEQSLDRLVASTLLPSDGPEAIAAFPRPAGSSGTRFRIIKFHARGGLGEVFVAADAELHREVALKRIQDRHGDHPDSRARFLLEAEITGGLEHPGIVPVYGLGHHDDGRPFYVMRFIKGDSLKAAIEHFHQEKAGVRRQSDQTLELQKLLRRFLDVCNAIAYAHSRGVLHRDIKPGNIMVGQFGETLVVDWGLAKVVGTPETAGEATLRPPSASGSSETLPGSAIGTPAFMSPEQAAGRLDQLGPASDVYSLGGTLYCLLTGKAPFEGTNVEDVLLHVQRGELVPPRQVKPEVPRALEAICLKAMALRPEDRYRAPRDLAEDIERWLADETVTAYREPRITRIARWGRRHKTLVTALAAAVLVATISLGTATALLVAANDRERKLTELARQNGETAQANFRLAFEGVDRYFTQVSEDRLLNVPGLQTVRRNLLDDAREFYQKFLDEKHGDATVQAELGRTYLRLARIADESDKTAKPIELAGQGLAILRPLMGSRPADEKLRNDVASGLSSLGYMHGARREIDRAERDFREAIKLWESLAHDRPDQPRYVRDISKAQANLGSFYSADERTALARAALVSARATARDLVKAHPGDLSDREALQEAEFYLGQFFSHVGEIDAAESAIRASFEVIDEPARQRPGDLRLQFKRSATLARLAEHLRQIGRLNESQKAFTEAASGLEKLVRENPTVVVYRRALFRTHNHRGEICEETGQREAAEQHQNAALKIAEELVRENPDDPDLQNEMAVALSGLFNVYYGAGRMAEAAAFNQRALLIREKIAKEHPQVAHFQDTLGETRHNQALQSSVAADQGIAELKKTIDAQRALVRDHPDVVKFRFMLASGLNTLGGLSYQVHRYDDSEAAFREAITEWRELVRREPQLHRLKYELGRSLSNVAGILTLRGKIDHASPIQAEAIELNRGLVRDYPDFVEYRISLAAAEDIRATIARDTKDFRTARDGYDRSIRALEDVLRRDPPNLKARQFLVNNRNNRAVFLIQDGDHRGALNELLSLEKEPATPQQRYNRGCAFSLLSAAVASDTGIPEKERAAMAESHAVRAIKLLGEAASAQWLKPPSAIVAHMKDDTDLTPIRSRRDYQELIKRIEAGAIGKGAEQKTISPTN